MPVIDSYDVFVLKSANGTRNGSQNFLDYSNVGHTITTVGNTQHSTAQAKFGTTSIKFDGSGDSLTIPHHTSFDLGAGDFTIDWWYYAIAAPTALATIAAKRATPSSYGGWLAGYLQTDNYVKFYASPNSTSWANWNIGYATNGAWVHFAITRQGNTLRFFRNGVLSGTSTWANTIYNVTSPLTIGENGTLNGYLEEFRISKGIARWTAAFTPPNEAYYRVITSPRALITATVDNVYIFRSSYTAVAELILKSHIPSTAVVAEIFQHALSSNTAIFFKALLDIILATVLEFKNQPILGICERIEADQLTETDISATAQIESEYLNKIAILFEARQSSNIGLMTVIQHFHSLATEINQFTQILTSQPSDTALIFESDRQVHLGILGNITVSRPGYTLIHELGLLQKDHAVVLALQFTSPRLIKAGMLSPIKSELDTATTLEQYLSVNSTFPCQIEFEVKHQFNTVTAVAQKDVYNRLFYIDLYQYTSLLATFATRSGLGFSKEMPVNVGITNLVESTHVTNTLTQNALFEYSFSAHTAVILTTGFVNHTSCTTRNDFSYVAMTAIRQYTPFMFQYTVVSGIAISASKTIVTACMSLQDFSHQIATVLMEYQGFTHIYPISTVLLQTYNTPVVIGLLDLETFQHRTTTSTLESTTFTTDKSITLGLGFYHSKNTTTSISDLVQFPRVILSEIQHLSYITQDFPVITGFKEVWSRQSTIGVADVIKNEKPLITSLLQYTDFQSDLEVTSGLGAAHYREIPVGITNLIGNDFVTHTDFMGIVTSDYRFNTELQGFVKVNHAFDFTVIIGTPEIHVITNEIYLTHRGKRLEILSVNLKTDRDSFCYSGDVEIAYELDFAYLKENDEVTLSLNGTDYAMVIDSLGIDRQGSSAKPSMKVEILSVTCRLDAPRSDRITKIWPATSAYAVCEEIAGSPVIWNFMDWTIPDGALAVTNATRIEVIKQVIQRRAMVQTRPNGTLHIQPWYPTPPALWVAPVAIFTEANILSHSIKYTYTKYWNAVQVSDIESGAEFSCEIEENVNDDGFGTLLLYPIPWTDTPLEIIHTGQDTTVVGNGKPVTETICEKIEFKDGKASVSKPIYEVIQIEWLYANLSPITTQIDSKEITASTAVCYGYSVARIKYRYRYWEIPVGNIHGTVQFLALH